MISDNIKLFIAHSNVETSSGGIKTHDRRRKPCRLTTLIMGQSIFYFICNQKSTHTEFCYKYQIKAATIEYTHQCIFRWWTSLHYAVLCHAKALLPHHLQEQNEHYNDDRGYSWDEWEHWEPFWICESEEISAKAKVSTCLIASVISTNEEWWC